MAVASIEAGRNAFPIWGRLDDGPPKSFDQKPRNNEDENIVPGQDDHARFARLVLPHLGDAYSLARWITGRTADAENVAQEACLRAFRAIGGVADASARPWALTIARNTAYTWAAQESSIGHSRHRRSRSRREYPGKGNDTRSYLGSRYLPTANAA